ncbi:uncharacterized protein MONOS_15757 [Monocercomonoides exilis]|uniref:uncharacterized protein n=1 Tax=Monocercomonoides exilis TaxID=2049356 RepID=UPI00355A1237|nr:hypothetical protein MONOS_15757 [Monocercomonoides exilis]|eukprot:MONOS_15757.1-p1 / transcript=MONOS_15757.1 / gene=MONOS_15757 / organism=Monocercomonoides_exilis_PA203 / gene_product=unspecified product / transcript_product=unspecified product / location=Mono_scaffold01344:2023-3362(+) / protein_length=267 / sequence_SO=supercontig / SO=protein_coding / is_pseudo=false
MTFLNEVEAEASPKYHVENRKLCEEWVVQSEETEALMEEGFWSRRAYREKGSDGNQDGDKMKKGKRKRKERESESEEELLMRKIRKEQDSQNMSSKRQTVVHAPAKAAIFNNIIAVDAFFRIAGRAFELLFSSAAHILQYFGASNRFGAQAALNGLNGHRMRNGRGGGKELQDTLRSSSFFMTPPKGEERGVRVQMEEAKKADFRSKLSEEQRKGRQQEEPKAKMKTKENDDICTSQIDAFETRLAHAATERKRRDWGREEGSDDG